MSAKQHFKEVLGWTPGVNTLPATILAAATVSGRSFNEQLRRQAPALVIAFAAAASAVFLSAAGRWTEPLAILIAGIAALAGGYSRPLAEASGRYIVLLVIALSLSAGEPSRPGFLLLMIVGAVWTVLLALVAGMVSRMAGEIAAAPASAQSASRATPAQKRARWKRSLRQWAGWQFPLRMTLSLALAALIRFFWPQHHYVWITITVVLLCQRKLEPLPVKTTQRALGVLIGVAATGLILSVALPFWVLVVAIGLLAGLRPWLRERSYLAYSACTTPLIIMLMELGAPPESGLLSDRLVATLAGAAIVIALNFAAAPLMEQQETTAPKSGPTP